MDPYVVQPAQRAPAPQPAAGIQAVPPGVVPPGNVPPPENKRANPNSTQNTLLIAEVRDGIVIMQDGSYRAVMLAQSINFDLMSQQEREGVEAGYQGFLNSLYFSIQIVVRSRRVDLRGYMSRLEKIRTEQDNILLGLLMDDYIAYVQYLASSANIMDKQFYVVIPYYPTATEVLLNKASKFARLLKKNAQEVVTISEEDFLKAKTEMKNRVQAVLEAMNQMGVQAVPLNTQELIELYYDVYNPDTAAAQPLIDYQNLEGEMVTKAAPPVAGGAA
jgi:type IV secretory pathway VirB4 component